MGSDALNVVLGSDTGVFDSDNVIVDVGAAVNVIFGMDTTVDTAGVAVNVVFS